MILLSSAHRVTHISLATGIALALATLSGCGIGSGAPATGFDTAVGHMQGTLHGGPNPINNATVTLYATGNASGTDAYGIGQILASTSTDPNGSFTFSNPKTCPANQYAYVVATGGKTGSNNANPNSVLMAAIGPCTGVSSSTFILINELTTVAAGYALSNFMNITGSAVAVAPGYTVGIGAPATNNASTGCVNNAFYGTGTCPTTSAAGLGHAFANATALVTSTGGTVNATTAKGAIVPVQEINTLGNILQACVNSNGGGTDLTTGTPTTTTSTAGHTTYDGTPCGKLFAYASYTVDGTASGSLVAPGNTLSAIQNLAKRPTGSATLFDSNCSSGGTGTTTATTCIFNLGTPVGIYQTSMTTAPPEWTLGISYPKGSLSTASNGTACSSTPATNGVLYPYMVATDINDDVVILNEDNSTALCYNLLTVAFDGTPLEGNGFDKSNSLPIWVSTDAFGHAIVPVHGTDENGIRIFGATDTNVPLVGTIAAVINTPTYAPFYTAVDQNDGIYMADQPSAKTTTNNFGYAPVSGTESHTTPVYGTPAVPTPASNSNLDMITVDPHGVGFTTTNSSTSGVTRALVMGAATDTTSSMNNISTSGIITATDSTGNIWNLANQAGGSNASTTVVAVLSQGVNVIKQSYTTSGSVAIGTASAVTTLTPGAVKPQAGQIDGNNVIWFADIEGGVTNTSGTPITVNPSALHGYDTVNNFDTHDYYGCKFANSASTACGSQPTDSNYPSNTPYLIYGTRGLAIDATGSIWLANGTQGQIDEIIGLAAPTWPLFIHNGTSNKP